MRGRKSQLKNVTMIVLKCRNLNWSEYLITLQSWKTCLHVHYVVWTFFHNIIYKSEVAYHIYYQGQNPLWDLVRMQVVLKLVLICFYLGQWTIFFISFRQKIPRITTYEVKPAMPTNSENTMEKNYPLK